jgi:hypothetical protein
MHHQKPTRIAIKFHPNKPHTRREVRVSLKLQQRGWRIHNQRNVETLSGRNAAEGVGIDHHGVRSVAVRKDRVAVGSARDKRQMNDEKGENSMTKYLNCAVLYACMLIVLRLNLRTVRYV